MEIVELSLFSERKIFTGVLAQKIDGKFQINCSVARVPRESMA